MKKYLLLIIITIFIQSFSSNLKDENLQITLNLKFDKYFNEDLNKFIYVKNNMNIRKEATIKSEIVAKAKNKDKFPLLDEIKNEEGKITWYKIKLKDGKEAYIYARPTLKRGFDWENASYQANNINKMISLAMSENKKIYYLDFYQSLLVETDGKVDKYGNSANQSVKAYFDDDYINLQDRSLVQILNEDNEYIYIKTLSYGDKIYKVEKKYKRRFKDAKLNKLVNKFIFIDRKSQTQITLERDEENRYNVNAVGYVTTGLTGSYGFVTPYGDFLVAYTKPVMKYVSDTEKEDILDKNGNVIDQRPIIVGEANMAVRFSGGGYLHGIPATYGDNIEERKKITEDKLGTFELSHKCVRHADDLINYVYNWVNEGGKLDKRSGFIFPNNPVIVIVR